MGNQLLLDGWNRYVVPLGGVNIEAGIPLARWEKSSLWLYGSYYYLTGDYLNGSSGARARAEWRLGDQISLGATISYDNIFQTQASGYLRIGSRPLLKDGANQIAAAERDFLALRGQAMPRQSDIRMVIAQQNLPRTVAINPATGLPWVVRCSGASASNSVVNCAYPTLDGLVGAATSGDVLLVGGGTSANLASQRRDAQGRPTLYLPAGVTLTTSPFAPTLATQFGAANLGAIFGTPVGATPSFNSGVINIGSNTTISGFNFTNASITSNSTSNVLISNNTFIGSYTDNPTSLADAQAYNAIQVSSNALPAIQLTNVANVTIATNAFIYPQVQAYLSQMGSVDGGGMDYVCNQNNYTPGGSIQQATGNGNTSGLCLSGNAIRINSFSNVEISGNSVIGALDEAFRLNNPIGTVRIINNTITGMSMGPDSNIGSAIILGMNSGAASVEISGNTITNNIAGLYKIVDPLVDGKGTVSPAKAGKNAIDPIELGLCRGKTSYPRMSDLYASPDFSGDCDSPANLSLNVSNNVISLPSISTEANPKINQDGDGIDLNIGANAILNAMVANNQVSTLGGKQDDIGDNGLTFDIRGNANVSLNIVNNYIYSSDDAGIGFSLQNTSLINNPGSSIISLTGNTFGELVNRFVEADLVRNIGIPVSTFQVFGTGTNELINKNVTLKTFNSGAYPLLFINGVPFQ